MLYGVNVMNIRFFCRTSSRFPLNFLGLLLLLVFMQACHYGVNNDPKRAENDPSPINTTFNIEQREIVLINGHAEQSAMSDPKSKIISQ